MVRPWKAVSLVVFLMLSTSLATAQMSNNLVLTPLTQLKSGIVQKNISCKQGFELILKSENSYPVCIRPQTAQKLIERGWALPAPLDTSSAYSQTAFTPNQDTYSVTTPPQVVVTDISSTMPGMIKIVSVEMHPAILEVGDEPVFAITFKNVYDKPIYLHGDCASPPLSYAMHLTSGAVQYPGHSISCPTRAGVVQPNQTYTLLGVSSPLLGNYKITDLGKFLVDAKLNLFDDYSSKKIVETIQFDVIVADNRIPHHELE